MTLGERIKKVRKELDLTQQKFADRLGVKQNTIALIESGKRNTSDQLLFSVCREFNVSETWLRSGEGEPFIQQSKEDELASAVNKLLTGETSEFKNRLIKILADLKPQQWEILESYALKLIQDKPTLPLTMEEEARAEAEQYYQQRLSEKKQASQALSVKESDVG